MGAGLIRILEARPRQSERDAIGIPARAPGSIPGWPALGGPGPVSAARAKPPPFPCVRLSKETSLADECSARHPALSKRSAGAAMTRAVWKRLRPSGEWKTTP